MTQLVLDASTFGNLVLADKSVLLNPSVVELLQVAELVEPSHWPIECCGLVLRAARRERISPEERDQSLASALELIASAEVEQTSRLQPVIDLALQYQLSIYDAAYLEVALRRRLPLLTSDSALAKAAAAKNVELVEAQ